MSLRIEIDRSRPLHEGAERGHNRWHPGLEPVASVDPGEAVTFELRDSRDRSITRDSGHDDLLAVPAVAHPLTGPLEVRGAEPGDVLELEVLAYETDDFGWTAKRPRFPCYEAPPRPARAMFATTGIPLDDDGGQGDLDLNLAARRALLELLAWLEHERGLGREPAYVLMSVAAELRVSELVDAPNALVSAALPLEVLEA